MSHKIVNGLSSLADLCIVLVQTNIAYRVLDARNLPNPIDSDKIARLRVRAIKIHLPEVKQLV